MKLIVVPLDGLRGLSDKTARPFEHYAVEYPMAKSGTRRRLKCWVGWQLWIFQPPDGWDLSWIGAFSPDMQQWYAQFRPENLGEARQLIAEGRDSNLRQAHRRARKKLIPMEQARDAAGLMAVLVVSAIDAPK